MSSSREKDVYVLMLLSFHSRTLFVGDIKAFSDATIAAMNHDWSSIREEFA